MTAVRELDDSASRIVAPDASETLAGAAKADPLSDVLRTVRLRSSMFFLWDVSWPFAMPVPDGTRLASLIFPQPSPGGQRIVSYHVVTEGACWGGLVGGSPERLEAGDIMVVPRGSPYVMASSAQACREADVDEIPGMEFYQQMAAGELPFVVRDGGGGEVSTLVICGFLSCDELPFNPVLSALPPLVKLTPDDVGPGHQLRSLVGLVLAEARASKPGSECVLLRLSELMYVEVVRRCLSRPTADDKGWLASLSDPIVGRALVLLHREPARAWSVDELAKAVGASRSLLAEQFTRMVGEPPMRYLAQWRMQVAASRLSEEPTKVAAIAEETGFASVAAFSRAFKRATGLPPAEWRRQTQASRLNPPRL